MCLLSTAERHLTRICLPQTCQEYIRTETEFDWQIEIDSTKVLWREVISPRRGEHGGAKLTKDRVRKSVPSRVAERLPRPHADTTAGTNDSQVLSASMSLSGSYSRKKISINMFRYLAHPLAVGASASVNTL